MRARQRTWIAFAAITLIFIYTTVTNVIERPDGVQIATWFIVTIIVTSLISRVLRSTELRVHGVNAGPRRRCRTPHGRGSRSPAVSARGRKRADPDHREPSRHGITR